MGANEQFDGFSIIICSYNGSHKIKKVIECLKMLNRDGFDFEIIIVDNNSTDNTFTKAQDLAIENPALKISIIKEQKSGKTNALFAGFNKAIYKYLLVCDDDNWLDENYLTVAFSLMEQNDRIGVIGGRGFIQTENQLPVWFSLLENSWAVGPQANMPGEIINRAAAVWGAGMVIRKDAWDLLLKNGFKVFLTGRKLESLAMAGEDTELCILIKALRYKIYYEKSLVYRHDIPDERLKWKNLLKLWEGFSRSQVYFSLYENIFYNNKENNYQSLWRTEVKKNLADFFGGATTINFYKSLYIAFVENREGYLPGLEKRKYLTRVKELLRIKKSYAMFFQSIAQLKNSIDETNY